MKHKDMGKAWKKIAAVVLTAAMITSASAVSILADTTTRIPGEGTTAPTDKITPAANESFAINISTTNTNTDVDHKYEAYQIFSGDLLIDQTTTPSASQYDDDIVASANQYTKTLSNIQWGSGVDSTKLEEMVTKIKDISYQKDASTVVKPFETVSPYDADNDKSASEIAKILGKVTAFDDEVTQLFADVIGQYLGTAAGESTTSRDSDNKITGYTISNLKAGYYLVQDKENVMDNKDDTNTRYMLNLVANVNIEPKADYPSSEKKVKENTKEVNTAGDETDIRVPDYEITKQFNDVADYNLYEPIAFELIGTVPDNYDDYEGYAYMLSDSLDEGLTFIDADNAKFGTDSNYQLKVQYKNPEDTDFSDIATDHYNVLKSAAGIRSTEVLKLSGAYDAAFDTDEADFVVAFPVNLVGSTVEYTMDPNEKGLKDVVAIKAGAIIRVTFYAYLNDKAEIGNALGNLNASKLYYSNNPNAGGEGDTGTTPVDKVIVFTYELDTTKIDGTRTEVTEPELIFNITNAADGKSKVVYNNVTYVRDGEKWYAIDGKKLPAAEFVLYRMNGNNKEYVVVGTEGDAKDKVQSWTATQAVASTLTSDENGLFKVIGLDDGEYYLQETKAPKGYNLIESPIKLTISANTINDQEWTSFEPADALKETSKVVDGETVVTKPLTITVGEGTTADTTEGTASTGIVTMDAENNRGVILPSTGGIGTTMFYVIGAILVIGAGVILITRRRMAQ